MKEINFFIKQLGIYLGTILTSALLLSTLEYFNLLSSKTNHIILILINLILLLVTGMIVGKNTTNKGYLSGMKIGGFILLSLLLLNTIFLGFHIKLSSFIYYLFVILLCVIGAMIGINQKKK